MYVSADRLQALFPSSPVSTLNSVIEPLFNVLQKYEITTLERVSMFLAQVGQESGGLTVFVENLNYGAPGLLSTFPTHFTPAEANAYARQPERIANRVYANRMGNGPESSGDGWKFRGRGPIQITGHDNYEQFGRSQGTDANGAISILSTPAGGMSGAGWFWDTHSLNALADTKNVTAVTRLVNGPSMHGLSQRQAYFDKAMNVFAD